MRIVHRISLNTSATTKRELANLGVNVGIGLVTFEVDESHPQWPTLAQFVVAHEALDIVSTRTTHAERATAEWLEMAPTWHAGYPQPEDGYLTATYDLTGYCPSCGIGALQQAPFRMRGEPKWGSKGILQLNWVFDEYFVKPDVWEDIFRPRGVGSRSVLDCKSGTPLRTVVQCDFGSLASSQLDLGNHPFRRCSHCERVKFLPVNRGCFPAFAIPPSRPSVMKSREYFGDGGQAFRAVIVSQDIYRAIHTARIRGCEFKPVCVPTS